MKRTTIRLEDGLMEQAKREAARRGQSFTQLVEASLRAALVQPRHRQRKKVRLPVSHTKGGPWPGIDMNNRASLLAFLEEKG